MRRGIGALAILAAAGFAAGCQMPDPIRVMSFNIRVGTANDGVNRWESRRELVAETIAAYEPDVLGLQECLAFQGQYLDEKLRNYAFVAAGRGDGRLQGEMVPIFYNTRTFRLVAHGHLWLSEQPGRPGSLGWDAALPRMLTWARLRYRRSPLNVITVINTHFDHKGRRARVESARIVRSMAEMLGGKPVIVLGDFNAGPDSEVHRILTEDRGNRAELCDVYAWLNNPEIGAGTYNGFDTSSTSERIDWILSNRRFEPLHAGIDRSSRDGRVPSDHFPVMATLRLIAVHTSGAL